jgi:hypothetical protein
MLGRWLFFGLMLGIGIVACADGGWLKHVRGAGHGHHHDDYGGGYDSDDYGYGGGYAGSGWDYTFDCGFDDEGVYHPCPCVDSLENYEPCGLDDEGVYHNCPLLCDDQGAYDEYPDAATAPDEPPASGPTPGPAPGGA